jgi:tetratricopeptide (TPR) repeat protein
LYLDKPINNLYDVIAELPDREDLNIVFIEGFEKSLEPYIKPGYGGDGDYYNLDTVPTILGHLNQRREIFRDHFKNICFVFFLPLFAVKYIIRCAPDFYDWSAGVFEFTTEADIQKEDLAQYKRVGFQYRRQKKYDQAIEVYQQALLISKEIGDLKNEVDILDCIGVAYSRLKQYEDAIQFHQQSLIIAQDIKDREGESNALYFIGDSYYNLGQYEQAIKFTKQSLDIAHELNNYQGESTALHNLGLTYCNLKQYQQAIDCFQKSLTIEQEIDDPQSESITLNSLGRVYNIIGQDKQAINYYKKQLVVAYKIDNHNIKDATTNTPDKFLKKREAIR